MQKFSFVFISSINSIKPNFSSKSTISTQTNLISNLSKFYINNKKKRKHLSQLKISMSENEENFKKEEFLTEDKGIIKNILKKGKGIKPQTKSIVKVHYTGKLENGQVFDSSLDRKDPYIFEIDQGKVIKGWEIGIKTMELGEKAKFIINSKYGYKKKGIPPIIPPNAKLFFEIELLEVNNLDLKKGTSDILNQELPRTPEKIQEEFEKKILQKNTTNKNDKMGNFFFISPFQSQSGEKAPWWLNPSITFILVFAVVFLLFYFVLSVGGIHQGYVEPNYNTNFIK